MVQSQMNVFALMEFTLGLILRIVLWGAVVLGIIPTANNMPRQKKMLFLSLVFI